MYSYFKDPLSSFLLLLTHGARLVTRKHAATGAYISRLNAMTTTTPMRILAG